MIEMKLPVTYMMSNSQRGEQMPSPLLEIHNATKIYSSSGFMGRDKRSVVALDDFNLTIDSSPATITTIAGESGSGKTTLANLVLGFIRLSSGQIIFDGKDVTHMDASQLLNYRRNVQAVFQDPFGVYNPFYRVEHVFDLVNHHFKLSDNKTEYQDMVEEGLNVVGLYGVDVLRKYPHQLSGGQRQRIMMARAYMIKPQLIVADEPVSMVDASLRASILDAMLRLRDESNISFLYITHDLSTAYQIGDNIYMLYQGTTAERGDAVDVIDSPQHPYVQLLIDSVPVPDPREKWDVDISLPSEEEMRTASSKGCRYYPRCPHRMDKCLIAHPPLYTMDDKGHEASCYLYDENEIAPIRELSLTKAELEQQRISSEKKRTPMVAVVGGLLIVAVVLMLLARPGEDVVTENVATEDVAVVLATDDASDTQSTPVETEADNSVEEAELPAFMLTMDDATDMGALEFGVTADAGQFTAEGEKHSYTFEGTAGQTIGLKVNGSSNAFTSPYGFLYDPDGEFVVVSGDTTKGKRSMRVEQGLDKDGTYTIIVGPIENRGIVKYEVSVEDVISDTTEDDAASAEVEEVELPVFMLTMDDATDMGALEFGVTADAGQFTAEGEKHSYTFEGTAGQTIEMKVNGSSNAFTSPYGFLYDPDGEFAVVSGDTTKGKRSMRVEQILDKDGTYTIIVGPIENRGIVKYEVTVELVEA
jgi:peptide/nickel transport system ATP-binding protein